MKQKWTDEKLKELVKNEEKDYQYLGMRKDKKYRIYLLLKCNNDHPYEVLLDNFKRGVRCPLCKELKWTDDKIIEYIKNEEPDYNIINISRNDKSLIIVKLKCKNNHIYDVNFSSFQSGCRCKECFILNSIKTNEEYLQQIKDKNINIKVIGKYIHSQTAILHKCENGHDMIVSPSSVLSGYGCIKCFHEKLSNDRCGENNPSWKGGITPFHQYLRNHIIDWKKESMKHCNYKCVITGDKFDNIHHLYGFDKILEETLNILDIDREKTIQDYSDEELFNLKNTCIELHKKYPLGVCLRTDVHDLFHQKYGKGNNTPEQFEEFKLNYK